MKKLIFFTVALLFAGALTTPAFAVGFDALFMTSSIGSTTPQSSFSLGEAPYLYVKVPPSNVFTPPIPTNNVFSFWTGPSADIYSQSAGPDTATEKWLTLSNWSSVQQTGEWNINASFFYSNGLLGSGSTSLQVVPEPGTMALLLMGFSAVAVLRRRKT